MTHPAPTSTEATPPDEPVQEVPITSRQRLLPLLVLCVAMMGVGSYFALRSDDGSSTRERTSMLAQHKRETRLELESLGPLGVVEAPVLLSYTEDLPEARRYVFEQSNRTTQPEAIAGTTSTMSLVARASKGEDGERDHRLDFEDVELRITAPGEPGEVIGQSVADQLQKTISASTLSVVRQEMGAVESTRWQNRINNQVKPAMSIIESGLTMLAPVVPRTPVEQGEPWYASITLPGVERDAMTLTGKVDVETTLVGTLEGDGGRVWHVLAQKLEVKGRGVVREDRPLSYQIGGQGQGVVLFDVKAGRVHRHSVTLQTTLQVEREGDAPISVTSEYLFGHSPASPEVGQQ